MASTGEVACFGVDQHEALLKSLLASNFKLPTRTRNILVSLGPMKAKVAFVSYMKSLKVMGYKLYCTENTHEFFKNEGVECLAVSKPGESGSLPNALELIKTKGVDMVINVPGSLASQDVTAGYHMRRAAVDFGVSLVTNTQLAVALVQALERVDITDLKVRAWNEYVKPGYRQQVLTTQPGTTPQHRPVTNKPQNLPNIMSW